MATYMEIISKKHFIDVLAYKYINKYGLSKENEITSEHMKALQGLEFQVTHIDQYCKNGKPFSFGVAIQLHEVNFGNTIPKVNCQKEFEKALLQLGTFHIFDKATKQKVFRYFKIKNNRFLKKGKDVCLQKIYHILN